MRQLLDRAIAHHQRGQLGEAERLYLDILKAEPRHFDAQHLLGVIRHQQGRSVEALALIGAALQVRPDSAQALANQGAVLCELRRYDGALASRVPPLASESQRVCSWSWPMALRWFSVASCTSSPQ